jgi:hypothetical protein
MREKRVVFYAKKVKKLPDFILLQSQLMKRKSVSWKYIIEVNGSK